MQIETRYNQVGENMSKLKEHGVKYQDLQTTRVQNIITLSK